jgi:hypothetical protein
VKKIDIIDKSYSIIEQIEKIERDFINGNIKLLDYELVPLFESIESSLEVSNIDNHSSSYKKACELLYEKFKELKKLIRSFESEKLYLNFLKEEPTDQEITALFKGCWKRTFILNQTSAQFLEACKTKLCAKKKNKKNVLETEAVQSNEEFRLKIPKQKFSEKMIAFYQNIQDQLPCPYKEIFKQEKNQIEIYEKFIYLLHLIQMGKIKYQKETNYLYQKE